MVKQKICEDEYIKSHWVRNVLDEMLNGCPPQIALGNYTRLGWKKTGVFDVIPQVLHQVGVWIVCDTNTGSPINGTHKAGEAGTSAKLENRVVLNELGGTLFYIA